MRTRCHSGHYYPGIERFGEGSNLHRDPVPQDTQVRNAELACLTRFLDCTSPHRSMSSVLQTSCQLCSGTICVHKHFCPFQKSNVLQHPVGSGCKPGFKRNGCLPHIKSCDNAPIRYRRSVSTAPLGHFQNGVRSTNTFNTTSNRLARTQAQTRPMIMSRDAYLRTLQRYCSKRRTTTSTDQSTTLSGSFPFPVH